MTGIKCATRIRRPIQYSTNYSTIHPHIGMNYKSGCGSNSEGNYLIVYEVDAHFIGTTVKERQS